MAITITDPGTDEGRQAIVTEYYRTFGTNPTYESLAPGLFERILGDINDWFASAESKISASQNQGNPEQVAQYEDWTDNLQRKLDAYGEAGIDEYLAGETAMTDEAFLAQGKEEVVQTDLQKMEAGEMQPTRNAFIDAYGEEGDSKYKEALTAWKDISATEDATLIDVKDPQGNISQVSAGSPLISGGYYTPVGGTAGGMTTGGGTTDGGVEDTMGTDLQAKKDQAKQYISDLYNNGLIAYDEFLLYSDSVNSWEAGEEVNFDTVMANFDKLKEETIDPYYGAKIKLATNQVSDAKTLQEASRQMELEGESLTAQQNLASAKANFEQSGMTFTGQAVESLGKQAATTGTGFVGEGLVPTSNRLMSDTSALRYQDALQSLAEQSEQLIGSEATASLGLSTVGGFKGTLPESYEATQKQALTGLYQQEGGNIAQGQTVDLLSS